MAKIKTSSGFRFVKELGGAVRRATVSFAAQWLVDQGRITGRVLDYGCGFGFDADHFGWQGYDPYYRQQQPDGLFDTIICNHVLNMLTRATRQTTVAEIQSLLTESGRAFLVAPRNIPTVGKVAMRKRIQNYVVYDLPSLYVDNRLEIYELKPTAEVNDLTDEIEKRLKRTGNR